MCIRDRYIDEMRGNIADACRVDIAQVSVKATTEAVSYTHLDVYKRQVLRGENRTPAITALYKKLLINQFHDILPGAHIHPVFQDAMADYREIETCLLYTSRCV